MNKPTLKAKLKKTAAGTLLGLSLMGTQVQQANAIPTSDIPSVADFIIENVQRGLEQYEWASTAYQRAQQVTHWADQIQAMKSQGVEGFITAYGMQALNKLMGKLGPLLSGNQNDLSGGAKGELGSEKAGNCQNSGLGTDATTNFEACQKQRIITANESDSIEKLQKTIQERTQDITALLNKAKGNSQPAQLQQYEIQMTGLVAQQQAAIATVEFMLKKQEADAKLQVIKQQEAAQRLLVGKGGNAYKGVDMGEIFKITTGN